ncbi:MAG TPA: hypothetical protein VKY37_00815, partial [Brumimicrobium sp.]|nr:hypothetical protein [Brumimicrobium sp.]
MSYDSLGLRKKLKRVSLTIYMLIFGSIISFSLFSQAENSPSETVSDKHSQSPFDAVKGKKEDLSKRDEFSKHYINEDGSYTALIGAGPIHYEKAGQFLDIDHSITIVTDPSGTYSHANKTNLFESYFGATSNKGVKNKTNEGELREFLNTKMYWEVNGQATNTIASSDVPVSIDNDKAYYNGLFGNISAEFITLTGKRKLNYVISSAQDLGNIPVGAEYLVFTEDVELPNNWTHSVREQGVYLLSSTGEEVYLYENPSSTDATQELTTEVNTIFETEVNGSVLTIKTKVKTEWLLDGEREFPVKVDPTVNFTATFLLSIYDDGFIEASGFYFGRNAGYWLRTFATYDLSSIPGSSILNSVTSNVNLTSNYGYNAANALRIRNGLDPSVNSGTALYNSANTDLSNNLGISSLGWKVLTLNAAGNIYVQNAFGGNVHLTFAPAGSYVTPNYYTISSVPYLRIDYTIPSTPPICATFISPQNGINDAAHSGSLTWEPVSGAESYDVYFGTSPTPPLVSTSQTG